MSDVCPDCGADVSLEVENDVDHCIECGASLSFDGTEPYDWCDSDVVTDHYDYCDSCGSKVGFTAQNVCVERGADKGVWFD